MGCLSSSSPGSCSPLASLASWRFTSHIFLRNEAVSIDRKMLMEMLQERVADTSLLRLVGKCLHVGILDGSEYSAPDEGAAQGSSLSPLLGNVYLHHVLDEWFERDVLPRMQGKAHLIRYADDFVIGFEREDDAKRVMGRLRTTLSPVRAPPASGQDPPAAFRATS